MLSVPTCSCSIPPIVHPSSLIPCLPPACLLPPVVKFNVHRVCVNLPSCNEYCVVPSHAWQWCVRASSRCHFNGPMFLWNNSCSYKYRTLGPVRSQRIALTTRPLFSGELSLRSDARIIQVLTSVIVFRLLLPLTFFRHLLCI